MGIGLVFTVLPWALGACCAALALSGYVRMARADGGWRDPGCWHAPLILTSAALALLTAAGALTGLAGAVLAVIPLAVVALVVRPAWQSAAGKLGRGTATRIVLRGLAGRLRDALWNMKEDVRGLMGRPLAAPDPAPAKGAAAPRLLDAVRSVPPLADAAPGGIPFPEEVAAGLAAAGAVVSPEWQAVADLTGDFEPQDQDELDEHMASEAAGLLNQAEAAGQRAETLLGVRKLHPRYAAALLEVADGYADLASLAAAAHRVYHETYGSINEWHDAEDNELPEDARGWGFGGAA